MLNYDGFLNGENHKMIMEIVKIISEKTDYQVGDTKFFRSDNREEGYIVNKPRERESKIGENYVMNWVDNSDRWKEYPLRRKAFTFSNMDGNFFGENLYQVIPFKDVKIALSMNGDFNYAWRSNMLDTMRFDLGLSYKDSIGEGVLSSILFELLLFDNLIVYDIDLKELDIIMKKLYSEVEELRVDLLLNNDLTKRICNLIEEKIINNKDFEKVLSITYKNLIKFYLDGKGKKWNTYYQFVDYIVSPEINDFKIIDYVQAVDLGFNTNNKTKEYWINGKSIMVNLKEINIADEKRTIMDYVDDYLKE